MAPPDIWFWLIAAGFTLVAVAILLRPLRLTRDLDAPDQAESNATLYRGQLDELERDLANGVLDAARYAESRRELERRLLEEAPPAAALPLVTVVHSGRIGWALVVLIPLTAFALYLQLGRPDALAIAPLDDLMPPAKPAGHAMDAGVDALVARLAARLRDKTPDDGEGWALLAHSYVEMQRHAAAAEAFAKAVALLPRDPGLLADYADALAMAQGRRMEGKPAQLVEQALALDPHNEKALMLAATREIDRHQYAVALQFWERLSRVAAPGSNSASDAEAGMAETKALMAGSAPVTQKMPSIAAATRAPSAIEIKGEVSLAPALAHRIKPSDTLFIFARAASGPRMPVAIITAKANAWPYQFTLSDSTNVMPGRKLSEMESVVVVARISASGQAGLQSGDLEGATPALRPGGPPVKIDINRIAP